MVERITRKESLRGGGENKKAGTPPDRQATMEDWINKLHYDWHTRETESCHNILCRTCPDHRAQAFEICALPYLGSTMKFRRFVLLVCLQAAL
eukprot:g7486.t1